MSEASSMLFKVVKNETFLAILEHCATLFIEALRTMREEPLILAPPCCVKTPTCYRDTILVSWTHVCCKGNSRIIGRATHF